MLMVIKTFVDKDATNIAVGNVQNSISQVDPTLIFRNGTNVRTWIEQMDLYFMVDAISHPETKAKLLLRHLDADVLKTIKSTIKDICGNYDLNKITKTLLLMYGERDMAAMRYRTFFNERQQSKEENIHSYVAA